MKFSFVLLTWNRHKFIQACLQALIGSIAHPQECEIIVMDNGSSDETPAVLASYRGHKMVHVVTRKKNYGLNAYKKLLGYAKGTYIVIVDDDVLSFPPKVDATFAEYMQAFPDYGFLALNVIQNEFTNGAKPTAENYAEDARNGRVVEQGPTGGWCSCFRRSDYRKLRLRLLFSKLGMGRGEDNFLANNFERRLRLKSGIIRDAVCFHASGPYYAREYGHLDREIEKYMLAGLAPFAEEYKQYRRD